MILKPKKEENSVHAAVKKSKQEEPLAGELVRYDMVILFVDCGMYI